MDILVSGKTSFKVEVPYRLGETGPKGPKPLIIYLHGAGQHMDLFERKMKPLTDRFAAYHLFIQGPYAELDRVKYREKFGYSWYLYNGRQGSFVKSLEYTAEFIQEIVDGVLPYIKADRVCVLGYSMGGYQAAYFATTRWKHCNDLVVIGGRVKTELLAGKWSKIKHLGVLAVHGMKDTVVDPLKQKEHIDILRSHGLKADFHPVNSEHGLTNTMLNAVSDWWKTKGYPVQT